MVIKFSLPSATRSWWLLLTLLSLVLSTGVHGVEALPDLVPIADASKRYVHGWRLDQRQLQGRTIVRFSTAVGNRGTGPLELWGGSTSAATQAVYQRLYDSNGTSRDRLAGDFIFHPTHGHVHFDAFAIYHLRRVAGTNAVGDIIASGGKTSFCLINIDRYWPSTASAALVPHGRGGDTCGQIQGISPGYADVYGDSLPDQWIDVTDVPSGTYWLEVVADPDNRILESDESNNVVRIQITYTNPTSPEANTAPQISDPGAQVSERGQVISIPLTAGDAEGDPLSFSATGLPAGLSIGSSSGRIIGTVSNTALSSYNTIVSVTDGRLSRSVQFNWRIESPAIGTGLRGDYYEGLAFETLRHSRTDATIDFNWALGSPAPSVPSDGFSVRWSGTVLAQFPEPYTFFVSTDEGSRLWVNGQLIIDRWTNRNAVAQGQVTLPAGQAVAIILESQDTTGVATAQLQWSSLSQLRQVIPQNRLFPTASNRPPTLFTISAQSTTINTATSLALNATDPDGQTLTYSVSGLPTGLTLNTVTGIISGTATIPGTFPVTAIASDGIATASQSFTWSVNAAPITTGLLAHYYNGPAFNQLVTERLDSQINFAWGASSPAFGVGADDFTVRWEGEILPAYTETYTFSFVASPGVKLWVNNSLLIYEWQGAPGTYSGQIALTANTRVPIKVEYSHSTGSATARLSWSSARQPLETVPSQALFPRTLNPEGDLTAPTLSLTAPPSVTGPFSLSLRSSEPLIGLSISDFIVTNGTVLSLAGSGTEYSASIAPSTPGSVSITLPAERASDAAGNGNIASNPVVVLFGRANQAPVINSPGTLSHPRGQRITVFIDAYDPDGNTRRFSAVGLPPGLSINTETGVISGVINDNAAATHTTRISVTDGGLTASTTFTWNVTGPIGGRGLLGEYHLGKSFETLAFTRLDPQVGFEWGYGSPDPRLPDDGYSVRWRGTLTPPASTTYTFTFSHDDGVRITIGSTLIVDQWAVGGPYEHSGTITLSAGVAYPIIIEFFEDYDWADARLFWQTSAFSRELVPSSVLSPPPTSPIALAPLQPGTSRPPDGLSGLGFLESSLRISRPSSSEWMAVARLPIEVQGRTYHVEGSTDLIHWTPISPTLSSLMSDGTILLTFRQLQSHPALLPLCTEAPSLCPASSGLKQLFLRGAEVPLRF